MLNNQLELQAEILEIIKALGDIPLMLKLPYPTGYSEDLCVTTLVWKWKFRTVNLRLRYIKIKGNPASITYIRDNRPIPRDEWLSLMVSKLAWQFPREPEPDVVEKLKLRGLYQWFST